MRIALALVALSLLAPFTQAQLDLRPDIEIPDLADFEPLPAVDPEFNAEIQRLVAECDLNLLTPANQNPDGAPEWSSICVVDISDLDNPRVGGWQMANFVYPASAYKMYVLGEAIRQVCEGEIDLDDPTTVEPHNVRGNSRLEENQVVSLAEILRLMIMYSDNTASNVAIDVVDRQRASALMRALGCEGSDITRKFLSRSLEDEGYAEVPGTESSALHFATFLWAAETGAIGGGRGRGLIRAYLAHTATGGTRIRAGIPQSATLFNKTGTWNTFSTDVGMVEDGDTRYIICVMTAMPTDEASPRIARFAEGVHALLSN